jgi:hypothetical protein
VRRLVCHRKVTQLRPCMRAVVNGIREDHGSTRRHGRKTLRNRSKRHGGIRPTVETHPFRAGCGTWRWPRREHVRANARRARKRTLWHREQECRRGKTRRRRWLWLMTRPTRWIQHEMHQFIHSLKRAFCAVQLVEWDSVYVKFRKHGALHAMHVHYLPSARPESVP